MSFSPTLWNRIAGRGRLSAFLGNCFICGAVALFVYFVEQAGLIEKALNRVLYLLLLAIGSVIRYKQSHALSLTGISIDAGVIAVSAAIWTWFRTAPARILGNILLLTLLVPVTIYLFNRHGVLVSGVPIIIGITVVIMADAVADLVQSLLKRRIVEEKQEAEFSVLRHLAHNVKPSLQIIRSPLAALRGFLAERGLLGAELSQRLDGSVETVGDALENAIAGVGQINAIIDSTRKLITREINRDDFHVVELQELLAREVFPRHAGWCSFLVHGGPVRLRLHPESLVEAFNNLIRNARMHGFPEPSANAELRFVLSQTRKRVNIDYTNNGRPFPDNLSAVDFLSFGKKSNDSPGEGLGGAWVGKVIEAHGGSFSIIRDGNPVHFRITLPKGGR